MNKKHIGSNFDDFLEEEGILEDVDAVAVKRVIVYQIAQLMHEQKLTKIEMSRRLDTSRAALDRLLDPANTSITLQTMERASKVLGKKLQIKLI